MALGHRSKQSNEPKAAESIPDDNKNPDADAESKFMNVGANSGCYPITAPDGTIFRPNEEVRYPDNAWAKAQTTLEKVA